MRVPASYPVIGEPERTAMHAAIDKGWLTAGPINEAFEKALADYIGVSYVRTCNSGSSANLLATAALFATGHLAPGQGVSVPAVGFPTTINPLLLYGAELRLVDVDPATLCPVEPVEVGAHPLGNGVSPAPTLFEDCCDALGTLVNGVHVGKHALVGTLSFFPAHHITTGEGGAVFTNDLDILRAIESLRDWGRDCWCAPGANNTCGMRFKHHFAPLPPGYDHKYTFTHLGFNLKMTEVAAACGLAQMARLPDFVRLRRRNHAYLTDAFKDAGLEEFIELPQASFGCSPSWFGFHFTLRERGARASLQAFLAERGVDSRLVFAGNLALQPYMQGRGWRREGELVGANRVTHDSMWIGCWPGLGVEDLEFAVEQVGTFFGKGF